MDAVLGYIAEIGLNAVKDQIKDASMKAVACERLTKYLKNQRKLNFNCTMEEEIDFEGLSNYICNDLIEDVKLRLFEDKGARENAHKAIDYP